MLRAKVTPPLPAAAERQCGTECRLWTEYGVPVDELWFCQHSAAAPAPLHVSTPTGGQEGGGGGFTAPGHVAHFPAGWMRGRFV